jgi:hypothetical protein
MFQAKAMAFEWKGISPNLKTEAKRLVFLRHSDIAGVIDDRA